jgi:hypothetical protein
LFYWSLTHFAGQTMPDLNFIRAEIEHMRRQIVRHRKEIQDLQRAGIATKSADELLVRMQAKVDGLCEERDRLVVISAESTPEQIKSLTGLSSGASVEYVTGHTPNIRTSGTEYAKATA